MRALALLAVLLPLPAFAQEAGVTMYGASWCGPCGAVKAFLQQNRVPFEYVDIDQDLGRQRYEAARGSFKGIPLTVVAGQAIRGANLTSLAGALQRAKLLGDDAAQKPSAGESYGGHSAAWWQVQFRQLRGQLARMDQEIARGEKVAFDHHEKELLDKLREDREIVAQSIDQLESDASNVSLPRKFRE
jgi:glutaredoxin